jgi:hypothetical protein
MAKKQSKNCGTNIPQNPPSKGRQLEIFTSLGKRHKPQICSIPGVFPKQRDRYRVMVGDRILGDRLNLDEAIALANQSTHL